MYSNLLVSTVREFPLKRAFQNSSANVDIRLIQVSVYSYLQRRIRAKNEIKISECEKVLRIVVINDFSRKFMLLFIVFILI